MIISKKIKLNNNYYSVFINVKYHKKYKLPRLYLKNYNINYWDEGDCSKLIEQIEKNYTLEKAN